MTSNKSILLLVLLPFFCLIQSVNAPFYFDDFPVIIDYEAIRSFSWENIRVYLGPRFIPYLTFSLNYQISSTDTYFYHLINIFLHICNGLIVYFIVKKLLKIVSGNKKFPEVLPLFSALVFVLHPVQSQAAVYIVQRSELFAAFFYFSAILYYLMMREKFLNQPSEESFGSQFFKPQHLLRYMVFLLLTCGAFLSKEVSATLPVAIFIIDLLFLSKSFKKSFFYLLPLLLILLVAPFFIFMQFGIVREGLFLKVYGAPEVSTYLLTEAHVFFTYVRLIFFPINLHLDYDYPAVKEMSFTTGILILIIISSLVFILFKKGLSPFTRCGFLLFILMLLPTSSLVPISDYLYEHRLYLPFFGVVLLFVSFFQYFEGEKQQKYAAMVIVLLVVLFTHRVSVWSNEETFWSDNIAKAFHKARIYSNLSSFYLKSNQPNKAFAVLQKGISLNPNNPIFYASMGALYQSQDAINKAAKNYEKALSILEEYKKQGTFSWFSYRKKSDILYNLSTIKLKAGEFDDVIKLCNEALKEEGNNRHLILNNLGMAYLMNNDYKKALEYFSLASDLNKNYEEPLVNRGIVLKNMGQFGKSIESYKKALAINPQNSNTLFLLGEVYLFKKEFLT
ncbi:MAG: tetratricopeptide repeat protein, partial [Nitrospinae bacterium]|nr:tetratricopeptide repeat protein [Nitrospinota bacterium]